MNLYEIDSQILDCVDAETGEIFDEDMFETLQMERDAKVENICLWIKNLKAEAEALKAEKMAFAKRQKSVETKMESLKRYISGYLEGTPFKSSKVTVSFKPSEAVEIDDINMIPDAYLKIKEPEADKEAIRKSIKEGYSIPGASIVQNQNIQIK